jgi:hypothetical protein
MTTSSVVGIPTGGTFIPRDISVGILKPRGCSYHCAGLEITFPTFPITAIGNHDFLPIKYKSGRSGAYSPSFLEKNSKYASKYTS